MSTVEGGESIPWQPLTFGGVAAFARAPFTRVLAMMGAVALIGAVSVVWFFHAAWEPSVRTAISRLPAMAAIRQGRLEWPDSAPSQLAEGQFLSIGVDPADQGELGLVADLQWEWRRTQLRIRSFLGHAAIPYPTEWTIRLNRAEVEPWWGAWQPAVLAGLGLTTAAVLITVWIILAMAYAWPVRIIAGFTKRSLSQRAAWSLAMAALMPGALLLSAALVAYGLQQLNLIQLLFAFLLHWVVGWVFLLISPFRVPRIDSMAAGAGPGNPFKEPSEDPEN